MKLLTKFVLAFNILMGLTFVAATPVSADMIVTPSQTPLIFGIAALIFLAWMILVSSANTLVEFGVIWLILKNKVVNKSKLFKSVAVVNFITTTPTLLVAIFILINTSKQPYSLEKFYNPINAMYLAELIPFIGEYFLLKWQFNKLYKKKYLNNKITDKEVVLLTAAANLTTMLIGVLLQNYLKLF